MNTIIRGNETGQRGGGIYSNGGQAKSASAAACARDPLKVRTIKMQNCLVTCNEADDGAGMFLNTETEATIVNTTISGNSADTKGGGIYTLNTCLKLHNSILWDDTAVTSGPEIYIENGTVATISYTVLEGGCDGVDDDEDVTFSCTALTSDPDFCDPLGADTTACTADDNLHLDPSSPAIDAGSDTLVLNDECNLDGDSSTTEPTPYDIDESDRFVSTVDMGAYEFHDDEVTVVAWHSALTHGQSVGEVGLLIASGGTSSESRNGGIAKLIVTFSGAIDPDTAGSSSVTVLGHDVNDADIDLSSTTITTSVVSNDTKLEISFSPKLPDYARYRVTLSNVLSTNCSPVEFGKERILTALIGDVNEDLRVATNDVGGVRSFEGTSPIDPTALFEVRCDIDVSGAIDSTDTDLTRDEVGNDARNITDP